MAESNGELIIFCMFIVGLMILLVHGLIYANNEEDISYREMQYCNKYGMHVISYVIEDGDKSYTKKKCVGLRGERTIDYNDEFFCKYKVKSEKGGC